MKKYYDPGNGTLSKEVIEKALSRLAQLLKERNRRVELVAAGGVISVLMFGSRRMTRDIDVIIPPKDKEIISELVDQVAEEQKLPKGQHAWLNDGVSFFGLQTKSNKQIFMHPNLVVYTASWYELLGMKLSGAWRRDADYHDAVHILRQIGNNNKSQTLVMSMKYRNFSPYVDDDTFTKRFNRTWSDAFDDFD
ncbi:hypothetical protein EUZ85_23370 [Hahella sp. KA22]|uniref:DUF6036 family nucleotidyltransferase n=1 Tax=Hahella sp. KA22 TaxID=1628392 RepID=UPI000FDE7F49|nr:DUF6036 family nucleotidyltransferase [Hahella sp. KA22]AZZ93502.1 hypothetical protein ENC22_20790 [Hahella sp. KA22]QAY56876.1 hypothetical protein EUZ85_23370 [Hahella sp. KA22]